MEANPANASCRRPDGWVRSIAGVDLADEVEERRALLEDVEERRGHRGDQGGVQADARASRERDRRPVGQLSSERSADTAWEARCAEPAQRRTRTDVAALEGDHADHQEEDGDDREEPDRRPIGDARERPVAGRPAVPGDRREGLEGRCDRPERIDQVPADEGDAAERHRPRAADERRGREADGSGGEDQEAIEQDVAEDGRQRQFVPWQDREHQPGEVDESGQDEHRDGQRGDEGADLLHGDRPAAMRRGDDQVEAAVGGLPARVPDRAMTAQSPSRTGRKLPTRQDRNPPRVSIRMGSPSRPWKTGGSEVICEANSARAVGVVNSVPYGAAVASMKRPPTIPTSSAARRLSRKVLREDAAQAHHPRPRTHRSDDGHARRCIGRPPR